MMVLCAVRFCKYAEEEKDGIRRLAYGLKMALKYTSVFALAVVLCLAIIAIMSRNTALPEELADLLQKSAGIHTEQFTLLYAVLMAVSIYAVSLQGILRSHAAIVIGSKAKGHPVLGSLAVFVLITAVLMAVFRLDPGLTIQSVSISILINGMLAVVFALVCRYA